MTQFWRIDANGGHEFEHTNDAMRVANAFSVIFRSTSLDLSTLLRNQVCEIALYTQSTVCDWHGNHTRVFLLAECKQVVTETNFVGYVNVYLHTKPTDVRSKMDLNNLKISAIPRTEYEALQQSHHTFAHLTAVSKYKI
jgi:hypothetical protein